jgi:hypothetical protein
MLGFQHPESGETMEFTANPPSGMQDLIERWRQFVGRQG